MDLHFRSTIFASTLIAVSFLATSGFAHSSIALGQPADVKQDGVAIGFAYNYQSKGEAESHAMDQCRAQGSAPDRTRALCHVVGNFDDECFSDSLDPAAGTYGFGWAVAATPEAANAQSLAQCQASAIDGRAAYCVVSTTRCDGTASPGR